MENIKQLIENINEITLHRYGVELISNHNYINLIYVQDLINIAINDLNEEVTNNFIYNIILNKSLMYTDDEQTMTTKYVDDIGEYIYNQENKTIIDNVSQTLFNVLNMILEYLQSKDNIMELDLTEFVFITNNEQKTRKLSHDYKIELESFLKSNNGVIEEINFLDKQDEDIEITDGVVKINKFDGVVLNNPQIFYSPICGENEICMWYTINNQLYTILQRCMDDSYNSFTKDRDIKYTVIILMK